jgi:hypothetical protein
MFQHGDYIIERDDPHNISLYKNEDVEIREGGGMGKGPGTPTGRFEKKKVHKGYFSTFGGALGALIEKHCENAQNKEELLALLEELNKACLSVKNL